MYAKKKSYKKGGLVGNQHKLDKNKDGKITGADFKMMEKGGVVEFRSKDREIAKKMLRDHFQKKGR